MTTAAPTTLATTEAPTTEAPTTTATTAASTTSAPTTTATTAAPTTATPDVNISAGPIEVSVSTSAYFSYYPAKERDYDLDARLRAGSIEIELSILGEQYNQNISAGPIEINVTIPATDLKIGKVISAGPIDISVTLHTYGIVVQASKCNWVKWSGIGKLDFTIDESNVAGERPVDWKGCVYKNLKFKNSVIVYGENGISSISPQGRHWGLSKMFQIGLIGPNAVVGTELEHYFILKTGDLFKLSESLEKLGYSEYLSEMTNPVMSLDLERDLIYICDGTYGYVYSTKDGSLGEGPANITGVGYQDGIFAAVATDEIVTPKLDICTGVYDLGIRKYKTLHSIEVGTNLTEHLYASVDYRVKNKDEFTQIGWFLVNPDGVAYPVCYGIEFRFRLRSYIHEDIEIDYLKINGGVHNFSFRDYLSQR